MQGCSLFMTTGLQNERVTEKQFLGVDQHLGANQHINSGKLPFYVFVLLFFVLFLFFLFVLEKDGKRQSTCLLVKIYNIRVIFAFTVHLSFPFPCKKLWHITCLMNYWSDDITLYCKKWSSISAIHDWLISVVEKGSINKYKKLNHIMKRQN